MSATCAQGITEVRVGCGRVSAHACGYALMQMPQARTVLTKFALVLAISLAFSKTSSHVIMFLKWKNAKCVLISKKTNSMREGCGVVLYEELQRKEKTFREKVCEISLDRALVFCSRGTLV